MPILFGDFFMGILGFLLFCASLFIILLVLVQRGRGGGLTGALGGAGGQSAFGAKAGDVFTKITVSSAIVWILVCLVTINQYTYVPVDNTDVGEYNYGALLTGGANLGAAKQGSNPDDGPGATTISDLVPGAPSSGEEEDPAAKAPAAEDPAAKDPAAKDPAAKDPAAKDPAAKDPAAKDPAAKDPAAKDPAAKDPAAKDPAAKDPAAKAPAAPAAKPAAKEPAAKEPAAKEPAAEEPKTPEKKK